LLGRSITELLSPPEPPLPAHRSPAPTARAGGSLAAGSGGSRWRLSPGPGRLANTLSIPGAQFLQPAHLFLSHPHHPSRRPSPPLPPRSSSPWSGSGPEPVTEKQPPAGRTRARLPGPSGRSPAARVRRRRGRADCGPEGCRHRDGVGALGGRRPPLARLAIAGGLAGEIIGGGGAIGGSRNRPRS
jgi:hypothetical protein